jgi:RND family efflux transporter MFP subunit
MSRTLRSIAWILLTAALGAVAIAVVILQRPPPPSASPVDLGPVPVRVRDLTLGEVLIEVRGYGTLLAARRASLAPAVGGPVVRILEGWRPGRAIEAGTELFAVDPTPYALEVRRGEALLDQATSALERARLEEQRAERDRELAQEGLALSVAARDRWEEMEAAGHASAAALDQARSAVTDALRGLEAAIGRRDGAHMGVATSQASLEQARAALDIARDRLHRTAVYAPFAGELVGRPPALGTYLAPGVARAELLDVSVLHLSIPVPEEDLFRLQLGLSVRVSLPSLPAQTFRGSVAAVGAAVNPLTRSAAVEIDVPNDAGGPARLDSAEATGPRLRAGQFAAAVIEVERRRDALTIGREEIRWETNRPVAYVVRKSPAGTWVEERQLELGPAVMTPAGADGFLVEGGLLAGEVLVLWPLARLRDGLPCRLLPDGAGASGAIPADDPDAR